MKNILKQITLGALFLFLTISFFEIIPAKAVDITNENSSKEIVVEENVTTGAAVKVEPTDKKLTIMVYCDADNDLEEDLLQDIQQMKDGYVENSNLNVIVLVDRSPDYSDDSNILGEDFSDTRMYKIEEDEAIRIDGGTKFPEIIKTSDYEANMGDAHTLKKFIDSCKENYPANKYVLIVSNHGGGARDEKSDEQIKKAKAVCFDETNDNDCLYTAEISDILTDNESVNVLVYDACLMGAIEVAYQYRPQNGSFEANVMVASPPDVWTNGYDYEKIFSRLKSGGGNNGLEDTTLGGKERYFDPSKVTDIQLGAIMIEAQRDSVNEKKVNNQVLGCYDLTKVESVKTAVDTLAVSLWNENKKEDIENLRGTGRNVNLIHYFRETSKYQWLDYPYFDLYDLCKNISISNAFSDNIKNLAINVMNSVDDMIVYSYGGTKFNGFTEGKNGLSIFLPDGSLLYKDVTANASYPSWKAQRWYNSIDTTTIQSDYLYGKLSWCKDGQDSEINKVGNWFELLDSWYDSTNDENGGDNGYQW
ncbi:clostripain [Clostridium sp. C2-6-12]|uniref:clostripain n=1 Tax=Clostridium sp. C2-6-12 TaxID=2698832 RepID=UPI00136939CC|nr:clostripain [Clostridium sp. C2-6-12]